MKAGADPLPGIARYVPPKAARPRPFWSVMLPVYNPSPAQLEQALRGVLAQDPGAERMQIEVVDDCSPKADVAALVQAVAGGRAEIFRLPANRGLAGCWNACLERARGQWVHLLHQDDYVRPGFYSQLAGGIQASPDVGAAFCRHAFVTEDNRQVALSPLERGTAGILANFRQLLAESCVLQCPSIVVKREVYEAVGGYNPNFNFALDWEMWLRIAARHLVWYEPEILACYRTQAGTETGVRVESGQNLREIGILLERAAKFLDKPERRKITARAKASNALKAVRTAEMFLYRTNARPRRNFKASWNQTVGALALSPSPQVAAAILVAAGRFIGAAFRRTVDPAGKGSAT